MHAFADWIYTTPLSLSLQGKIWLVALGQTIHILAIAAVLSSVLMVNLRVLRLAGTAHTITETTRRYLPWIGWGVVILLLSGAMLIVIEPHRPLTSTWFWGKMAMLLVAIALTLGFRFHASANPQFWDQPGRRGSAVIGFVVATVLVWCAIIYAGRWIAYASAL